MVNMFLFNKGSARQAQHKNKKKLLIIFIEDNFRRSGVKGLKRNNSKNEGNKNYILHETMNQSW